VLNFALNLGGYKSTGAIRAVIGVAAELNYGQGRERKLYKDLSEVRSTFGGRQRIYRRVGPKKR